MSKTSTVCHKRSSVITEGVPKQPTTDQIDYGEIAINYAASGETLYIKNSENAIAEFKDNKYYQKQLSEYTKKSEIVNSLSSTDGTVPLSANQGKVLNDKFGGYIPKTGGASGTIEIYSNTDDDTIIGNPGNMGFIFIRGIMHQSDDNWNIFPDGDAEFKNLKVKGSNVVTQADVVNSLASTDLAKPLSANMGRVLSDKLKKGDLIAKEAKMVWGGQNNNEGNLSPIESLLTDSANRLTFGNAEGVTVEYSTDGGWTWNAYTERTDYEKLLYPVADAAFCLGGSDSTDRETTLDDMLRITINAKGVGRYLGGIRKMLIYGATRNAQSLNVVLEAKRAVGGVEGGGDNAFEQVGTLTYDGWPAWGAISLNDSFFGTWNTATTYNGGSVIEYRLTFGINDIAYTTYGAPCIQLVKLHSLAVYEANEFIAKYGSPLQLMNDGYIHADRELYLTKRVQAQNIQVSNLNVTGSLNYTRARVETSEASVTLDASKYTVINCGSGLTINLPNGYATDGKEYVCELHTGSIAPTISVPSDIKFAFGENFVEGFEPNYVYQISIQNSLAVVIPFV